jgi:hypothetical protein
VSTENTVPARFLFPVDETGRYARKVVVVAQVERVVTFIVPPDRTTSEQERIEALALAHVHEDIASELPPDWVVVPSAYGRVETVRPEAVR